MPKEKVKKCCLEEKSINIPCESNTDTVAEERSSRKIRNSGIVANDEVLKYY